MNPTWSRDWPAQRLQPLLDRRGFRSLHRARVRSGKAHWWLGTMLDSVLALVIGAFVWLLPELVGTSDRIRERRAFGRRAQKASTNVRSLTFVRVGPVRSRSPSIWKKE